MRRARLCGGESAGGLAESAALRHIAAYVLTGFEGAGLAVSASARAVIFDMDGLLIDTIPAYAAAMVGAGLDVGHPISRDYVLSLAGLLGAELEARLMTDLGAAFPRASYFAAMSARLAPLMAAGVPLKPGAIELLQALLRRGGSDLDEAGGGEPSPGAKRHRPLLSSCGGTR